MHKFSKETTCLLIISGLLIVAFLFGCTSENRVKSTEAVKAHCVATSIWHWHKC